MFLICSVSTIATPATLADRFTDIIAGIRAAIREQRNVQPPSVGSVLFLVWLRMANMRKRFAVLVDKLRAGTLAAPRQRQRQRSASPAPAAAPDAVKLPPQSAGWLIRLLPQPWHVNYWRDPLEKLLADPEMAALLQAAPQAGRILRPLCRMLLIPLPANLRLPKRKRPPRKPAAKPQRPPRPMDPARMSRLDFARVLHTPRDTNTPPIEIAYARGWRPRKPDPT